MKKLILLLTVSGCIIIFQSSTKSPKSSGTPPSGYTGATGDYCVSCHGDFSLNDGGGSVAVTGLPSSTYTAGQQYNFSLNITHGSSNRTRWGFSIKAINSAGQNIGTFSSTNGNATNNGSELSHSGAVFTGAQSSYTYSNLKWTAPSSPTNNDKNVTFYYVANAANGTGGTDGDYIYAGSTSIGLPALIKSFTAVAVNKTVSLKWETLDEKNVSFIDIEKSDNGQTFYAIGKVNTNQSSNSNQYSFTDKNPSYFNKPIFYRIKIVDKDGSYKYSSTVSVKVKTDDNFITKIYPTIITSGTTITTEIYSIDSKKVNLKLIDLSGRVLQEFNYNINEGNNKIVFQPTVQFNSNIIFAKFTGNNFNQTISLLAH